MRTRYDRNMTEVKKKKQTKQHNSRHMQYTRTVGNKMIKEREEGEIKRGS